MEESVQEFWDTIEAQVGEKILVRCLGQCLSGHPDIHKERWGVFFLTGSSLYFKTFQENQGFLEGLIKRKKVNKEDSEELLFGIPFDTIRSSKVPSPKKFIQRIFTRPDEKSSFIYSDGTGESRELNFTIATDQDNFFRIFSTLLP